MPGVRTMLFNSLEFHFIAANGRPVRSPIPLHVLRGLFMNIIKIVDPSLASATHDAETMSAYAIQLQVSRENVFLTFNLFSKALNDAVKDFIVQQDDLKFNIGRLETLLVKVAVSRIDAGKIVDDAVPLDKFKIIFKTPTFLKSEGNVILFPAPDTVLKHLAHAWNELVPGFEPIDENALSAWAKMNARVRSYRLETASVNLGEGARSNTGFIGWAKFAIKSDDNDEDFSRISDRLLHFAEYTNIGGGRTTGLGAIRYLPSTGARKSFNHDDTTG